MNNLNQHWVQGYFIDGPQYRRTSQEQKDLWQREELCKVRYSPKGNGICITNSPDEAIWIANRLNLASKLEKMTYDFATGKTDGDEIRDFVKSKLDD